MPPSRTQPSRAARTAAFSAVPRVQPVVAARVAASSLPRPAPAMPRLQRNAQDQAARVARTRELTRARVAALRQRRNAAARQRYNESDEEQQDVDEENTDFSLWWNRHAREVERLEASPDSLRSHWLLPCWHCTAVLLDSEPGTFCCKLGSHLLQPLPALTPTLAGIAAQSIATTASLHLNQLFQFAVQGYSERRINFSSGPPAVAIEGTVYRRLLPLDRDSNPLNMYVFNPERLEAGTVAGLASEQVQAVHQELENVNPLLRQFHRFAAAPAASSLELRTEGPAREIAGILHYGTGAAKDARSMYVHRTSEAGPHKLSWRSELYEPLAYPVLFPLGSLGWPIQGWTQREYYRFRLLTDKRFTQFALLGSLYTIDMVCRMEDERLDFVTRGMSQAVRAKRGQPAHEVDELQPEQDATDPGSLDMRLPSSFVGSRAYRAEHVSDALALAKRFGRPSGMLTLTTNPDWPELREWFQPGQTATNAAMATVRVFKARLAKVMALFKTLFGKPSYIVKVIEFQRRGLPHAHIVFCLSEECPIPEIDKIVSARVPPDTQPRLRQLVLRHMVHPDDHIHRRDGTLNDISRCQKEGRCIYNFPQPITSHTTVDPVTYRVVYKRLQPEDQMIAQYCPAILLAWEGHAHIDFALSLDTFVYMFKYIHKGPDYVDFRFAEAAETEEEGARRAAEDYIRARYLSATEATWRIFGFTLTSKNPSVARLGVHEPGSNRARFTGTQSTGSDASSLIRYFLRPARYAGMKYVEYNEKVTFRSASDREIRDPAALPDHCALERSERGQKFKPRVVMERRRGVKVARIKVVRPGSGEVFYIRQLLLHKAASSWRDLRTTTNQHGASTVHDTFEQAAVASGILEGTNEAHLTMTEAVESFATSQELRFMFCLLIVDGAPAQGLWNSFGDRMGRDFLPLGQQDQASEAARSIARTGAMQRIAQILDGMGKSPAQYGLQWDEPRGEESQADRAFFREMQRQLATNAARARLTFTDTQDVLYETLLRAVAEPDAPKLHLIQGRAGRGKTYVANAAVDQLRAAGGVLAVTGATGLSASTFERGMTVHKMFDIPVQDQLDATPLISNISVDGSNRRAKFLHACQAIVIDEIWALHRSVIEAVDAVMRRIMNVEEPFGGKPVFAIGDPRQTAPIVPGAGKPQIIEHSFLASPLFRRFELHELQQSMRNGADPAFSQWVDTAGDDFACGNLDVAKFFRTTQSVEDARHFLFPPDVTADADKCARRAFLSPYNKDVNAFNTSILESMSGSETVYLSCDSVKGDVEPGQEALATPDHLNDLTFPGVPPHDLRLKVGTLCVLMRNMSPAKGLVKNAKVEVSRCTRRTVAVRVLASGETFRLPRINFEFQPPSFPFRVIRKQVPLRLAYALTFHGCQGATLDRTVIDCRLPVFTHGQRYASISRCRQRDHTIALLAEAEASEDGTISAEDGPITTVNNIVFQEFVEAGQPEI